MNKNTTSKRNWYSLLIDKTEKAIENKYYFEAIFIEYMLIDDRIKSLAKLAGINLFRPDGNPKLMGQLIDELLAEKKKQSIPQWNLLNKGITQAPIKTLNDLKDNDYPYSETMRYAQAPRSIINFRISSKSGKVLSPYGSVNDSLLVQIKGWVKLRNHWMHAAGNDNLTLEQYECDITPLAVDGNIFVRELSDITSKIKRGVKR